MKIKLLMLLMCVSAVTPALLGSATAGMIRANNDFQPEKLECPLSRHAIKRVATKKEQAKQAVLPSKAAQDVR